MPVDPSRTVAELVLERPSRAALLSRLGIDYCCGGRRTLSEACTEQGLDAGTVARVLEVEVDTEPAPTESTDWTAAPLSDLCAHLVEEHHERLRSELPRLTDLAERAAAVHGDALPELHELRGELWRLRVDLEEHIDDEERRLFPALVAGEPIGADDLAALEREHEGTGEQLRRLRELAGGYETERALCATHRALLEGLRALELDLHRHVHEENNILFPRALARG